MSQLWDLQVKFTRAKAKLILFAEQNGIELTDGDAYRDPRVFGPVGVNKPTAYGEVSSCHKSRLAQDFNVKNEADHIKLHDFWDTVGGSKRIDHDMNHYSFAYNGMR